MLDARSPLIMGYTMMSARAGLQPVWVFTLTVTFEEPPERCELAHVGSSEPAYNGIYSDGHPSESTVYLESYPDDQHDNATLKLGASPLR